MKAEEWPREKKWRHLYTRSLKLRRAQQLGFEYPRLNEREMLQTEILNVAFFVLTFVCMPLLEE
jgi:hypothetical protein